MARPVRSPGAPPPDDRAFGAPQLDLFPTRPVVEPLDPRSVVGPRTGVASVTRVRLTPSGPPHLVFQDRHGWYCETHGADCSAVALARLARAEDAE